MGKHKDHDRKGKDKSDRHKKKHKKKDGRDEKDKKHRKETKGKRSRSPSGSESGSSADEWLEKVAPGSSSAPATDIDIATLAPTPAAAVREDWMAAPFEGFDFSGTRGMVVPRKKDRDVEREEEEKRRLAIRSERELNPYFASGGDGIPPTGKETAAQAEAPKRRYEFGDSGSNWRMMKLRRVLETAAEESRGLEEVALERYGSLADFHDAQEERAFLDDRRSAGGSKKDEFGRDIPYRPTVRSSSSFQRPPHDGASGKRPADDSRSDTSSKRSKVELSRESSWASQSRGTPVIPAAVVPIPAAKPPAQAGTSSAFGGKAEGAILSKNELNALNSKVLKAKLMGLPNAAKLEAEYELQKKRAEGGRDNNASHVVLSAVDSRGQLQDIGSGASTPTSQGPQRKRVKVDKGTHDAQGNRLRYGTEEDKQGLTDLILQEKMAGVHDFDAHMADRIAKDATYVDNLDYMDDNIDNLAKRKTTTEQQKRSIAIGDFQKHEKAVARCPYCYHEGEKPKAPIVALGIKSYLALPEVVDMVQGHCLIVPIDHVLTTLECDDETWDEIRNFQKCLLQMFAAQKQGVVFMEQVINFKWHKHTVIECIPVPLSNWEDCPAYYKEAILAADEEWTQHRKLIDTSKHGFRRSMVKNLPYFHVWFDPNRGMGHVIEDQENWNEWFGREVIASFLDLSPDKWRRPRWINPKDHAPRMKWFLEKWKGYDWTAMLEGGAY
ncbi:CwfJ C-terminus 1-domain-containing protein-like protein [Fimicolochytrium jonesii]|uniref:CwfJ C-terminus 1-domain-containing protein-like protein n=1 Tax=Fimicolochytrium jonesii TaxID=1396493 RepID=UPI0022FEB444|nr:CwfJ C-terminus 1-domain-containing protein-like protein [Fimicolochytrium jonesii]KAI8820967.1 CwfJ C-terminus 1-domain-containing protein-like protein [Fimicolochytrium jonesii]